MNHAEAVLLCRLVKGACPQQAFDSHTPDMWAKILADIRFVDAEEAIVRIVARSPWCAPAEIIAEVKRMRAKRIAEFGPIDPPDEVRDGNAAAYREWWANVQTAIADGDLKPKEIELPQRDMRAIERVFPRPDSARTYQKDATA